MTPHGVITRLPTSFPSDADYDTDTASSEACAELPFDTGIDHTLFAQGIEDAGERLAALPPSWARHYAATTLASAPDPDDDEPSYTRGYRAALYGHIRRRPD